MCGNDFAVIGAVAELMATVITMIILCYSVTNNTVRNILCAGFLCFVYLFGIRCFCVLVDNCVTFLSFFVAGKTMSE